MDDRDPHAIARQRAVDHLTKAVALLEDAAYQVTLTNDAEARAIEMSIFEEQADLRNLITRLRSR